MVTLVNSHSYGNFILLHFKYLWQMLSGCAAMDCGAIDGGRESAAGFVAAGLARNHVSRDGVAGRPRRGAFQLGRYAKGRRQLSGRLQSCEYNDGRDGACDGGEWAHAGHRQHEGRSCHNSEIHETVSRTKRPIF